MVSIPSAQVEEALAGMYRIVPDKRGAFKGRIKHFQRLGFPDGTNTGKGKPANFSFHQFMQLVLAFELVQSGLAPSTASIMVAEWWGDFGTAFARTMVPDDDVKHDPKAFPGAELMFVIYFDAMWQLGTEGPVDERTEYFGLVKIVLPEAIGEVMADEDAARFIDSPWRALVIDARWLLLTALSFIREAGLKADDEAIYQGMLRGSPDDLPYALERISDVPS